MGGAYGGGYGGYGYGGYGHPMINNAPYPLPPHRHGYDTVSAHRFGPIDVNLGRHHHWF